MKLICPTCHKEPAIIHPVYGVTAGNKCLNRPTETIDKGIRPLTEYEKQKLEWYRNENKWIENIRDRKTVIGRDGKPIVVSQGKPLARQPAQYYKNGGRTK